MAESQVPEDKGVTGLSFTLKASTLDCTPGSTEIISFDGKGGDSMTLVGREVQWYYENEEPNRLELKCSNGRVQFHKKGVTEDWDPNDDEDDPEVCIDANIDEALDTLRGKRGKTLTILEAVVGQRESDVCGIWDVEFWKLKHRVIGIRLEGMDRLGYVYCKTERGGEED